MTRKEEAESYEDFPGLSSTMPSALLGIGCHGKCYI